MALNLLGAAGGRPNSAKTVQTVNAVLCSVYFFSSMFSSSILNTVGPAITGSLGVAGYAIYVGSLWYFDHTGKQGFPIFAGVAIGVRHQSLFFDVILKKPDLCWFTFCYPGIYLDLIFRGRRTGCIHRNGNQSSSRWSSYRRHHTPAHQPRFHRSRRCPTGSLYYLYLHNGGWVCSCLRSTTSDEDIS